MSKQTAVEWLYQEIINFNGSVSKYNSKEEILEQANKMFKEQIQDAYRIGPNNELWSNSGIDYYNETYKQILKI
jgi:hypothetical protein